MASLSEMLEYAKEKDARRGQGPRGLARLIDAGLTGWDEGKQIAARRQAAEQDAMAKLVKLQESKAAASKAASEAELLGIALDSVRPHALDSIDAKSAQPKDLSEGGKMATALRDEAPRMKVKSVSVGGVTMAPDESVDVITPEQFQAITSGDPKAVAAAFPKGVTPKHMELFNAVTTRKQREAQAAETNALKSENQAMKAAKEAQRVTEESARRKMARETAAAQIDNVVSTVNDAISKVSSASAGWGSKLQNIPLTESNALKNSLQTVKANIGFDKLQQMRESSKTGGALGAVSEMENKALQASIASLEQEQDPKLLVKNLETIKNYYLKHKNALDAIDYAEHGPAAPPPAGGKIKVSNGQETLEIDAADEADAAKDGYRRVN
jgi:hypothetical protein